MQTGLTGAGRLDLGSPSPGLPTNLKGGQDFTSIYDFHYFQTHEMDARSNHTASRSQIRDKSNAEQKRQQYLKRREELEQEIE